MKRSGCGALLALMIGMLCLSCESPADPQLTPAQTRDAVLGKWKIERVDNTLCRGGSCTVSTYAGIPEDMFEFRADSAFLVYYGAGSMHSSGAFKVEYTLPGAFILKQDFWSARYTLADKQPGRITLVCSYTGSDPYAKFTETYYLLR